jgi:hypothetical protein
MTENQESVLAWLRANCNASGIIRVSNGEIALIFGWSQQYARKILSRLVIKGHLVELQKGIGRRATKYQVTSGSDNRGLVSHNRGQETQRRHQHVPSHTQKPTQKRLVVGTTKKETLFGIGIKENARSSTPPRKLTVFENVEHPLQPVKRSGGPFKRFRNKWDRVEKWSATDFICYFSLVHRVRFGTSPVLNWPVDCGSARTLLKRLKTSQQFKLYIQVAFSLCRKPPNGMRTFAYDYFYEQVVNTDEDYIEKAADEFEDEYVFPWLEQESRRRSHEAALEYQRHLNKVYLGL